MAARNGSTEGAAGRRRRAGLAIAAGLALNTACTTVREARRAQDPGAVPPGERTATAQELSLSAESRLTLTDATDLALRFHPAMVQAGQALRAAELAADMARVERRPTLSGSASASRATGNRAGGSFSARQESAYGVGLDAGWRLLDFGKSEARGRQAAQDLFAAEHEFHATALDTAQAVRIAFFELLRAEALRTVAAEHVAAVTRQLEEARVLAEHGRRRPYDVTRAAVQLGHAVLEAITASNTVQTARATLNRTLGLAADPGYHVVAGCLPSGEGDVAAQLVTAREANPDLAALRARERAAAAAVDAAIAALYPDLSLSADLTLSGTRFPLAVNLSEAARLAVPLWDGRARGNRIRAAVTQLRSARARVAAREQQLFQELTVAVAQRQAAAARLTTAEATVAAALENADLVAERHRLGLASALELADARGAVATARAEPIRARCDHGLAQATLLRLTGEPDLVVEAWRRRENP